MPSKKYWDKLNTATLKRMSGDNKPYEVSILGKKLVVLPKVFSPKYFTDTPWFAREIPKIVKKNSFLEIGTGIGAVTFFVAFGGSEMVVATDINPIAVKNARLNFKKYKLDIPVRSGDMYSPIKKRETFDYIFWNHPFNYSKKKIDDTLAQSIFDYKYTGLERFLRDGKKHLNKGGKLLLGSGKIARVRKIKGLAKKHGYSVELLKKKQTTNEHGSSVIMDIRIYSLTPKQ